MIKGEMLTIRREIFGCQTNHFNRRLSLHQIRNLLPRFVFIVVVKPFFIQ